MKFTESHEWVTTEKGHGKVGITVHAGRELGEIVYIEFPEVGQKVEAGQEVAVLESTKAAADIYCPVSGTITAVNLKLKDQINLINSDPEGEGWLFELELSKTAELELLLERAAYQALVKNA
ncbi:MAG: glycine cleavage system protein GcvH [Chlamydiia bacterium]|nr:glycine cleavage system protein GcvH [Chlamydiia bacterium]MCP5510168.1 glycine cleavage system protein GcvH [Chlamydiales bacterium]HPE84563.1 glycine cleavage system protein GcvH [Chlamydiales bacterium]